MTTKVTVDAHAGWDVKVKFFHPKTSESQGEQIVKANTTETVYVHSTRRVEVEEMERD